MWNKKSVRGFHLNWNKSRCVSIKRKNLKKKDLLPKWPCETISNINLETSKSLLLEILNFDIPGVIKHIWQVGYRCRPYLVKHTGSHPNSEVKRLEAWLVLWWGTAREVHVLITFLINIIKNKILFLNKNKFIFIFVL